MKFYATRTPLSQQGRNDDARRYMDKIIKSADAADQNVKLAKALRKTLKK
ncbi:hypothetical protein OAS67_03990 [Alphaproteobacteria bacterium]|nr:hypothetical protein [Alphaproteobacteria bacterium]